MVFQYDPTNDYELEELDEYQLFSNPKPEIMPKISFNGQLPDHLIIGVNRSAHAFMNSFGFIEHVGNVEIGSINFEIKRSNNGKVWIMNLTSIPDPNYLAATIAEEIPVGLTTILDIVLDDQIYSTRRDETVPVMILESGAVKVKSSLPKLPIPGYITGFSAALLSMLENRDRRCRVFLAVSDYQSLSGINPEIVHCLTTCIPDLFPKSESENILLKIKENLALLKPMARSSMFV